MPAPHNPSPEDPLHGPRPAPDPASSDPSTPQRPQDSAPDASLEVPRSATPGTPSGDTPAGDPPRIKPETFSQLPLREMATPRPGLLPRPDGAEHLNLPPFPLPERYLYHRKLGEGGMGEVHRVFDRYLNRTMALKVIHRRLEGSQDSESRFLAEAQTIAQLQHPGIVPVYDVDRLEDGRCYFTMKEVHGVTLKDVIREVHVASPHDRWETSPGGWSFRRLIETYYKVCETVACAHERGVIHRDLKPSNLMVGDYGEVLVLDWGLAKVQKGREREPGKGGTQPLATVRNSDDAAHATRAGRIGGTVGYRSPEQARGDVDRLSPASDVYSLGAVLYEVLSGTVSSTFIEEWSVPEHTKRMKWQPPARRRLSPGATDPGTESLSSNGACQGAGEPADRAGPPIPEELASICERAMAYEAAARYRNAGELSSAVREWLEQARRRERGLAALSQVAGLPLDIRALREKASWKRSVVRAAMPQMMVMESATGRDAAQRLLSEADELEREADAKTIQYLTGVANALSHDPALTEARSALAHQLSEQAREADSRRTEMNAVMLELVSSPVRPAGQQPSPPERAEPVSAPLETGAKGVLNRDGRIHPGLLSAVLKPSTFVPSFFYDGFHSPRAMGVIGRLLHGSMKAVAQALQSEVHLPWKWRSTGPSTGQRDERSASGRRFFWSCAECHRTVVYGGERGSGRRFCSARCRQNYCDARAVARVPDSRARALCLLVRTERCPRCAGVGPLDVHVSYWVASMILTRSVEGKEDVCCQRCGRRRQLLATLSCFFLGWWEFPGGLFWTPLFLYRNIRQLISSRDPTTYSINLMRKVQFCVDAIVSSHESE